MIEVKPFKAEDLEKILTRPLYQEWLRTLLTPQHGVFWERLNKYYTVFEDGFPVVIGGVKEFWPGRAEAWLLVGQPKTENFWKIFRIVKRFLLMLRGVRRIEMTIDCESKEGHRWAELLGFKKEADRLEAYRPDGGDVSMYAMVRA